MFSHDSETQCNSEFSRKNIENTVIKLSDFFNELRVRTPWVLWTKNELIKTPSSTLFNKEKAILRSFLKAYKKSDPSIKKSILWAYFEDETLRIDRFDLRFALSFLSEILRSFDADGANFSSKCRRGIFNVGTAFGFNLFFWIGRSALNKFSFSQRYSVYFL